MSTIASSAPSNVSSPAARCGLRTSVEPRRPSRWRTRSWRRSDRECPANASCSPRDSNHRDTEQKQTQRSLSTQSVNADRVDGGGLRNRPLADENRSRRRIANDHARLVDGICFARLHRFAVRRRPEALRVSVSLWLFDLRALRTLRLLYLSYVSCFSCFSCAGLRALRDESEDVPHPELHHASIGSRRRDPAEVRRPDLIPRLAEAPLVEQVEHLEPQLQPLAAHDVDVLEQRQIGRREPRS